MAFKAILKIVCALLAVVLVAMMVILKSTDFNDYKGLIAEQAKAATGRDLEIKGDIKLAISLSPALVVHDVTFSNASWGTRPEMIKFKKFEIVVKLLPLISGNIQVQRFVFVSPDILLETNAEGVGNWVFDKGEGTEPAKKTETGPSGEEKTRPIIPMVREIQIENASLAYRDGVTRKTILLSLEKLKGRAQDAQSPISIEVRGAYDKHPFEVDAQLGSLASLSNPASPFPVQLEARLLGSTAKINGTVANPMEGKGLDLKLSVEVPDLTKTAEIVGAEAPAIGPVSLAAHVTDPQGVYTLVDMKADLGESHIEGKASLKLEGKRPRLLADLSSLDLRLDELASPQGKEKAASESQEKAAAPVEEQKRVFRNDPFPLEGLKAADVSLKVANGRVLAQGLELKDLSLDLSIEEGNLVIRPLKGSVAGGTLSADVALDGRQPQADLKAKINLNKIHIGSLLKNMKITDLVSDGKVDVEVDVRGRGKSLRELMAGLNGGISLVMGEGRIDNKYLDFAAADLINLITPGNNKKDQTVVNCFVCKFDIQSGMAVNQGLLLDTEQMTVAGEGNIDLAGEILHLTLNPKPKEKSLMSLAVPVNIRGALSDPSVLPDTSAMATGIAGAILGSAVLGPAGLLVPLVNKGTEGQNPCLEALSKKGKQSDAAASQQSTQKTEKKPEEKMEEKVKDVLKGLGGIFK